MKINNSNNNKTTEFGNINIGDVFKFNNKYYMKIRENTVVGMFVEAWVACAVDLQKASLVSMNDITLVEPVDGEFVVN